MEIQYHWQLQLYNSMINKIIIFSVVLTAVLAANNYTFTFNNNVPYAHLQNIYPIGSVSPDYSIYVNVSTPAAVLVTFITAIQLVDTLTGAVLSPATFSNPTATIISLSQRSVLFSNATNTITDNVGIKLTISAVSDRTPYVFFTLQAFLINNTNSAAVGNTNLRPVLSIADIARLNGRQTAGVKLVYFSQQTIVNVTLTTGSDGITSCRLDPVTVSNINQNAVAASNKLQGGATVNNVWLQSSVTPVPAGYYIFSYVPINNQNSVIVTYMSDTYACPFGQQFVDYYSSFAPCIFSTSSQPGSPCLSYDYVNQICTACIYGYQLSSGRCVVNTTCPQGQYYKFGSCLPANPNCATNDPYTPSCLTCSSIYLFRLQNGNCIPIPPPTCTQRQWYNAFFNRCDNVSPLCNTFNSSNGLCLTCVSGYSFSSSTFQCVKDPLVCNSTQYLQGDACINFPPNCVNYSRTINQCVNCAPGYYIAQGSCQQIQCPFGQIPSRYGAYCINVSPLCSTWDINGCLSCIYSNYVVVNGQCLQQIFGNSDPNCISTDPTSLLCSKCSNNYYLSSTKVCLPLSSCISNVFNAIGQCVPLPPNCNQVSTTGACLSCLFPFIVQAGLCVVSSSTSGCPNRQYLSTVTNTCVNVSPNCNTYDQTNGNCVTCVNSLEPVGGICCAVGFYYLFGTGCIDISTRLPSGPSACLSFDRNLGFCLSCNTGYKVNPTTLTTCIPV